MQMMHEFLTQMCSMLSQYPGIPRAFFDFSKGNTARDLLKICPPQLLHRKKKSAYLFRNYQPLKDVYILLEGNCGVEKYKQSGAVVTDNTRHPLQMFGLFEGLAGIGYYTATMRCITECVYLAVPIDRCLTLLRSDPELMWMVMQFLSSFLADYIDSSDLLILNDPQTLILSKLYHSCIGKTFPVTVMDKKEDMARDLNLNLRTMYRYLEQFYASGLLGHQKGKITITQQQHMEIAQKLDLEL